MSKWHIQITKHAEDDLRGIYEYIAFEKLEPGVAKNLIERIKKRVGKLNNSPQSFALYQKEPWKSRGLRRVNSGKYAIFYISTEEDKIVTVIRIMYGGRDIESIFDEVLDNESE
jgi:toxin ParE1/3/4